MRKKVVSLLHLRIWHPNTNDAGIAQLVEHFIRNEGVAGSNPVTSSKNTPETVKVSGFYFLNLFT